MRVTSSLGAAAMALLTATMPAHGQIIDIQQPNLATVSGFDGVSQRSIQSFVPSLINSDGAGVWVRYGFGGTGTVTGVLDMELWTGIPGVGSATEVAGGTSSFSVTGDNHFGGGHYVDVFWDAVTVTPFAGPYYLVFSATIDSPGDPSAAVFGYSGQNSNPYPGGQMYYQDFGTPNITDPYNSWTSDDFTFRTYASTEEVPQDPVATPEPASLVLLGTGLAGVMGAARRRRGKVQKTGDHARAQVPAA